MLYMEYMKYTVIITKDEDGEVTPLTYQGTFLTPKWEVTFYNE